MSIIAGAGAIAAINLSGAQNYVEYLFPFVFIYHIVTFTLTYPESTFFRKKIITILLSFSDLLITATVFQLNLPKKLWLWVIEYEIVLYMVCQLSIDELKKILSNDFVRLPLFVLPGYLKSVSLVSSLFEMSVNLHLETLKSFLYLLVVGVLKIASTVGVYYLDKLSLGGRFDKLSMEEIWKKFKVSVVGVCIAIEACAYYENAIKYSSSGDRFGLENYMFGYRLPQVYLVPGVFFAAVYSYQSFQYGKLLKEKLEE